MILFVIVSLQTIYWFVSNLSRLTKIPRSLPLLGLYGHSPSLCLVRLRVVALPGQTPTTSDISLGRLPVPITVLCAPLVVGPLGLVIQVLVGHAMGIVFICDWVAMVVEWAWLVGSACGARRPGGGR